MARSFPGTNGNYLNLVNPVGPLDISGGPAITISMQMLPVSLAGTQLIVSKTAPQYNLFINGGSMKFECGGQSLVGGVPSTTAWSHLAARKNSAGMGIFVGGSLAASNALNGAVTDTTADLRIGNDASGGSFPYNGKLAEIAIWSAALTDAEIAALAKGVNPLKVRPKNLAGYFPLWGIGSGEADLSGAAQNFSITGTVPAADHAPVGPYAQ